MPKVDLAKRRRIMQRSMKLGHCICDPKRPCPCEIFTEQGICPCAGERPDPVAIDQIRLTELVHNAGCASKIAPGDLEQLLSRLPKVDDPAIISGMAAGDDAGVYKLTEGVTLVQTVDVFTPCVDDPYTFGRICAANCLSDIYAMGGQPKTALSVLAFPAETQDGQIMYLMLKGAMEVLAEADCSLIGGHSIKDEEIKLGFAITGTIDADKSVSHETAKVGDVLVLTKPLGVGVLNFAWQIGRDYGRLQDAIDSMMELNKSAAEAMQQVGVSACTDVTGFGLLGHLVDMVRHSGVTAQVYAAALPALSGAVEALRAGVVPGAIERNTEHVGDDIVVADDVDDALKYLGFDAQTSGGLLIALPADRLGELEHALSTRGVKSFAVGRIVDKSDGKIHLTLRDETLSDAQLARAENNEDDLPPHTPAATEEHSAECCADIFNAPKTSDNAKLSQQAFGTLLKSVGQPGTIDAKAKELIVFALVVMARCEPCVAAHVKKALAMGITREELDEAAWCAVAMGGAPVKLFYDEAMRSQAPKTGNCC